MCSTQVRWDTSPELTELRLIGCSIELTWTQKSKSNTSTPKTNSQSDEWNHLLWLFNISHCSSTSCFEVMSTGEERVTAKSKPMMNLVSRCNVRDPDVLASTASQSPEKTRYESLLSRSSWNEQQPRTVLIKLVRMEQWRQVVFSRVEIWWNVEHKYGKTRIWQVGRR